jgi:hypothetical protein
LALVAGGFTTFGVLAKIAFDALAARREDRAQGLQRFADERRAAYDDFLAVVERQRAHDRALRALTARALAGETEMTDAEREAFPDSSMSDVVDALGRVRRLARGWAVISSAEAIVRLFGDMARANRVALEEPGPNDEITWFLLQRFLEDRVSEFLHGYREDLGLGAPAGAPRRWPIPERAHPVSLEESERIVREHVTRKRPDAG